MTSRIRMHGRDTLELAIAGVVVRFPGEFAASGTAEYGFSLDRSDLWYRTDGFPMTTPEREFAAREIARVGPLEGWSISFNEPDPGPSDG